MVKSGVDIRYWSLPLEETLARRGGVGMRAEQAFGAAVDMAEDASRRALADAGLEPGDVDAIVTSHTSSWSVPSLDVHLANRLGLRPTVTRMPIATIACGAGAQALVRAADHIRAHPEHRVLVVVGEALSTIFHRGESSTLHIIYRSLFGDSGAACIVQGVPHTGAAAAGGQLRIDDTLELVVPDTTDRYWGRIDEAGLHFDSTRKAATAARESLPYVHTWLADRPVEWTVTHPGGPGIISDVINSVGLEPGKDGRHSIESLRTVGNLGGAAVLDVLRRTHGDAPAPGAPGMLIGFAPGFAVAAVHGTWC